MPCPQERFAPKNFNEVPPNVHIPDEHIHTLNYFIFTNRAYKSVLLLRSELTYGVKSCQYISAILHLDIRWVHRLHKRALNEVDAIRRAKP